MKRNATILIGLVALAIGCGELDDEAPRDDIEWLELHATDYLEDRQWRRAELEASMWRPELPYARKRLAGYALDAGGWDRLPELEAVTGPVFPGEKSDTEAPPMQQFSTQVPSSRQEWIDLGEAVFWTMPMRSDVYLEWLAQKPELLDEAGFPKNDDGSLQGIVRFKDARGEEGIGASCGLCHGGDGVAGKATADLDLGLGRSLYNEYHGQSANGYDDWDPGRIDITDDGVDDPLRIPNLWGLEYQEYLNTSGAVKIASPASLAVRFETQYIIGHGLEARPNRVLTWALAIYVLSLEPPEHHGEPDEDLPGAQIFTANCTECHNPQTGYGGGLVDADLIVGESAAADSPLRGTGMLKVPTLIGVGAGGPYRHDARHATFDELLEEGHPYGDSLTDTEIDDLIDFLKTL